MFYYLIEGQIFGIIKRMSKVIKFIKEVIAEFKHISWPKKDALFQLTFVVICISAIVSLILGGFDYLFTSSFAHLGKLKTQPVVQQQIIVTPSPIASPSAK